MKRARKDTYLEVTAEQIAALKEMGFDPWRTPDGTLWFRAREPLKQQPRCKTKRRTS